MEQIIEYLQQIYGIRDTKKADFGGLGLSMFPVEVPETRNSRYPKPVEVPETRNPYPKPEIYNASSRNPKR